MLIRVYASIENKRSLRDPEGETILKDLVLKGGYSMIKDVRVAKTIRFLVEADGEDEAVRVIERVCEELRLYNPVVSRCRIGVGDGP